MKLITNLKKWSPRVKNVAAAMLFLAAYTISAVGPFVPIASAAIVSSSVSSTGFVISGAYSSVAGQPTGTGQFKNGNVGAYPEGACIPAVFQVKNTSGTTGDLFVTPVYDYSQVGTSQRGFTDLEVVTSALNDVTTATNLNQMAYTGSSLSAATSFKTTSGAPVSASVSGAYAGNNTSTAAVSSADTFRHYNVTLLSVPANETVNVLLCGRLGLDASEYNGSSLSIRTVQGGQENVPIPVNQILALPSITLTKTVAQGTALPSDFSFTVSPAINGVSTYPIAVGTNSVTIPNVSPDGVYTVTESGPAGYVFSGGTGTACAPTQSTVGTASGQMVATVSAGKPANNAICNFTNNVLKGSITITKDAVPNGPQDFAFTTTGTGLSAFSLDDDSGDATLSNTKTFAELLPGTYSVTETATNGWDLSGLTCTGGGTQVDGATVSITLAPGANVSCTYTNRQHGQIIVNKVTNPANDQTAFSVTASGTAAIVGNTTRSLTTSSPVTYEVSQGTYSVSETVPTGWTQTANTCSNLVINGNTPLVNGIPTVTCTITNTKLAKLKIVKDALPNDPQDFAFTTTGTGLSAFSLDDDSDATLENSHEFVDLAPGTYTVTEASTGGWSLTGLTCDTNNFTVSGAQVSVNLAAGQVTTCTYTNTKLGSISGTKYEVNADGSTVKVEPNGWIITLFEGDTQIASTETGTDGSYEFTGLLPGEYILLESPISGWTQIYGADPVSLLAGGVSIENDFGNFKNGSISGYKFNDYDGQGDEDSGDEHLAGWTMTLYLVTDEGNVQVGDPVVTNSEGNYGFTNLAPGTYWVCETGKAGWVQTYPADNACNQVVIDESGEENEAVKFGNQGQGTITVKKNVDSNGDGTVDYYNVSNWTWDLGGDNLATGTTQSVAAGSFTVHEDQKEDYHFTNVVCTGTNSKYAQGESIEIMVEPGANVVCTFTNTRDTGWVKVVKEIYPENDEGVFDLLVDETVAKADASDGEDTGWVRVLTGSHTIAETAGTDTDMAHYDSSYSCWQEYHEGVSMSGNFPLFGEGTATDVTVGTNQNIVCSFYNERHATITIVKDAQPNDAQDFEFTLTPLVKEETEVFRSTITKNPIDFSALETNSEAEPVDRTFLLDDDSDETLSDSRVLEVSSGRYMVAETPVEGWDLTDIDCGEYRYWEIDEETGELYFWAEPGSDIVCTFTNTKRATVTITKDAQPNFAQPFNFTTDLMGDEETGFSLTDDGVSAALASKTFSAVVAGTYFVSESVASGWTLSGITCTGATVTREGTKVQMEIEPGADVRCTFVNQKNTIPQVLGAVDPPKLEQTGTSVWAGIAMSMTVMGLALITMLDDRRVRFGKLD